MEPEAKKSKLEEVDSNVEDEASPQSSQDEILAPVQDSPCPELNDSFETQMISALEEDTPVTLVADTQTSEQTGEAPFIDFLMSALEDK